MDADQALYDIRELVGKITEAKYGEIEIDDYVVSLLAYDLAEKFDALDEWMSSNGYNPFHGGL